MEALETPFTNLQMELLQLYKSDVPEEDLLAIKKLIANYFAAKAIKLADEIWEKEGWDEGKVQELLRTRMRTPYNKSSL